MEGSRSLVDALRHDAEIEVGFEDGDCILSHRDYHEGVLRLANAAKEVIRREASSEYASIYAAPAEFARILREALRAN